MNSITWDESGRIFCIELNRNVPEAVKFYDCIGNPLFDYRDNELLQVSIRLFIRLL